MRVNSTTTKHKGLLQGKTLRFNRGFRYFSFGFVAFAVSVLPRQIPLI